MSNSKAKKNIVKTITRNFVMSYLLGKELQ